MYNLSLPSLFPLYRLLLPFPLRPPRSTPYYHSSVCANTGIVHSCGRKGVDFIFWRRIGNNESGAGAGARMLRVGVGFSAYRAEQTGWHRWPPLRCQSSRTQWRSPSTWLYTRADFASHPYLLLSVAEDCVFYIDKSSSFLFYQSVKFDE